MGDAAWIEYDALLAHRLDHGMAFGELGLGGDSVAVPIATSLCVLAFGDFSSLSFPHDRWCFLWQDPHELLALLRRWTQCLPSDAKLLSAHRPERRLW